MYRKRVPSVPIPPFFVPKPVPEATVTRTKRVPIVPETVPFVPLVPRF